MRNLGKRMTVLLLAALLAGPLAACGGKTGEQTRKTRQRHTLAPVQEVDPKQTTADESNTGVPEKTEAPEQDETEAETTDAVTEAPTESAAAVTEAAEMSPAVTEKAEGVIYFNDPSMIGVTEPRGPLTTEALPYDTGYFSLQVPAGWAAFERYSGEKEVDKTTCDVAMGTTDPFKIYEVPYITIICSGTDSSVSYPDSLYSDKQEMEPWEIGGRKWERFSAVFWDNPVVVCRMQADGYAFDLLMTYKMNDQAFDPEGAEVQMILESLTFKGDGQ